MGNPLERFGIQHLSPSSLNLWRDAPGIWSLRYLARISDDGNAKMWRGTAVETGFEHILRGRGRDSGLDAAIRTFEANAQGELSDECEAQRGFIPQMLDQCTKWAPPCDVIATQLKVEHWLADVPVPVIGFCDFIFENGLVLDLKTTERCPSKPSADHVRQVALYMAAREAPGALLYVSHVKHAPFEITEEQKAAALGDMTADALSLIAFLDRCRDAKDAMSCLPLNKEHFRYPKTKVPLAEILMGG